LDFGPPCIGAIVLGSLEIISAKRGDLEITMSLQHFHKFNWINGNFRHGDFRQHLSDDAAFGWIVVDKHKRIQTDVQLLCNAAKISHFVRPISDETRNILQSQNHVRMFLKNLARDLLVILAAYRQNYPAGLQSLYVTLKRKERFAFGITLTDANSVDPIVTD